jgi:undecaprenyl-diphosphatase
VAVIVAFASGWFAVWFLVSYLRTRSLVPFAIYRLALAAVIAIMAGAGLVR